MSHQIFVDVVCANGRAAYLKSQHYTRCPMFAYLSTVPAANNRVLIPNLTSTVTRLFALYNVYVQTLNIGLFLLFLCN